MAAYFATNAPQQPRPPTVRVQCEAKDCRALLEVAITPECQDGGAPVIVRCGSCQRLLEVNLSQGPAPPLPRQPHAVAQHHAYQYSAVHAPMAHHPHPQYAFAHSDARGGLSMRHQLVQPPPLSRYHQQMPQYAAFYQDDRGMSYPSAYIESHSHVDVSTPSYFSSSPRFGLGGYNPFADSNLTGSVDHSHSGADRKKKRERKVKPRNPSPYNLFMSDEVKRIKAENPSLDHREAFKQAANNWARSPNNCSNRRMAPLFGLSEGRKAQDGQGTEKPVGTDDATKPKPGAEPGSEGVKAGIGGEPQKPAAVSSEAQKETDVQEEGGKDAGNRQDSQPKDKAEASAEEKREMPSVATNLAGAEQAQESLVVHSQCADKGGVGPEVTGNGGHESGQGLVQDKMKQSEGIVKEQAAGKVAESSIEAGGGGVGSTKMGEESEEGGADHHAKKRQKTDGPPELPNTNKTAPDAVKETERVDCGCQAEAGADQGVPSGGGFDS